MTKEEIAQAQQLIDTPITAENLQKVVPVFPKQEEQEDKK